MRVLLTGASSFTGCWFAEALATDGASVVATCRRMLADYRPAERRRLDMVLAAGVELAEGAAFGDAQFLRLLRTEGPFDLLCHHGAEVGNFRRADYDALTALSANTHGATAVMDELARSGAAGIVVTGTIFEPDEGSGNAGRPAFNAYGLAKHLSWQTLRFHAERAGLAVGRFVVPHPIGPLEKPGFTSQIIRAWLAGEPAIVRRPQLVRDFIHVDFLAAAYAGFCRDLVSLGGLQRLGPSGHVGSLLDLARLIAKEIGCRIDRSCSVMAASPPEPADEPLIRCNSDPVPGLARNWPFGRSWDRLAKFYSGLMFSEQYATVE